MPPKSPDQRPELEGLKIADVALAEAINADADTVDADG